MSAQAAALVLGQTECGNDPSLEKVPLSGSNLPISAGHGSPELNQRGGNAVSGSRRDDHLGRAA